MDIDKRKARAIKLAFNDHLPTATIAWKHLQVEEENYGEISNQ